MHVSVGRIRQLVKLAQSKVYRDCSKGEFTAVSTHKETTTLSSRVSLFSLLCSRREARKAMFFAFFCLAAYADRWEGVFWSRVVSILASAPLQTFSASGNL